MTTDRWIASEELASAAAISTRAVTKAFDRAAKGRAWNGAPLIVRPVHGRGGRSGLRYEVALSSLPEGLQEAFHMASEAAWKPVRVTPRNNAGTDQAARIGKRFKIIEPALTHPPRSRKRAEATTATAGRAGVSVRTVERWIVAYEEEGYAGLGRRKPSDAGRARIVVSREFDAAVLAAGRPRELLAEIGAALDHGLKGLWKSRAEAAGWAHVAYLAQQHLFEVCQARGVVVAEAQLRLARSRVERFSGHRVVNQWRNDRKAFDDNKPRIRRDWTGVAPMARVIADVKHLDVCVTRPDGSTAWPKIVAFMDGGTGRVFAHPVLLAPGEGVRQEHVIEAFIAMISHPEWGFPSGLYLDNGGEFFALDKMTPALELISTPGARTIIHAKPYNASAKPVESLFARLDRYVFSQLPGYAGGDRMRKKTQTVGKPPAPYPGAWDDFTSTVASLIDYYNHRPVGGQWGKRSPNAWLQEKVEAGWRPVRADPLLIDAAFCGRDTRQVDRGIVSIKGRRYTHPQLAALPHGTTVTVALPWRRGAEPLFSAPGASWAYLEPDLPFPADWVDGARESARRQRSQARAVAKIGRAAPELDPVALQVRAAGRAAPVVMPRHSAGALDTGTELRQLAAGKVSAEQQRAENANEEERRRVMRDRETQRLLRTQARVA